MESHPLVVTSPSCSKAQAKPGHAASHCSWQHGVGSVGGRGGALLRALPAGDAPSLPPAQVPLLTPQLLGPCLLPPLVGQHTPSPHLAS